MESEEDFTPTRLCCGKKHWTVACPDGKVMCCICFDRFTQDELYTDEAGDKWDECRACGEYNESFRRIAERGKGLSGQGTT